MYPIYGGVQYGYVQTSKYMKINSDIHTPYKERKGA